MKKSLWALFGAVPLLLASGCLMETSPNGDPTSTSPSTLASDQALEHTSSGVDLNGPGPHPLDPPPPPFLGRSKDAPVVGPDGTVLTFKPVVTETFDDNAPTTTNPAAPAAEQK